MINATVEDGMVHHAGSKLRVDIIDDRVVVTSEVADQHGMDWLIRVLQNNRPLLPSSLTPATTTAEQGERHE